jgi:hypothetical protein
MRKANRGRKPRPPARKKMSDSHKRRWEAVPHPLARKPEDQNDLTLHFGLGNHKDSVKLEIRWTDGTRQELETAVDRTITVKRAEGNPSR